MAPIKQQMLKPSDMKYLVSQSEEPQLGFDANVLDYNAIDPTHADYIDPAGYEVLTDKQLSTKIKDEKETFLVGLENLQRLIDNGFDYFERYYSMLEAELEYNQRQKQDLLSDEETNAIMGAFFLKYTKEIREQYGKRVLYPDLKRQNEANKQARVDAIKHNKQISQSDYVKRIQNTNLGAYSTQKLEGESDENYILRMESLKASLPTPDRAVAMEKEKEKLQFRSYLSAVASPTVAETIINDAFFTGVEGERHVRLLVRAWPSFLKELKETYSKLDVSSFLEFAQSWVDKIETTKGVKNPVNVEPEVIVDSGRDYRDLARRISATKIEISNTNGNRLELTPTKKVGWKSFEKYPEFWELFTDINRDGKRVALQALYVQGFARLQQEIDPIPQAVAAADVDNDGGGGGGGDDNMNRGNGFKRHHVGKPVPKHRKKYGHGISAKTDEPEYREFGRLIVSMPKLSDGILRVLYASNGINIAGIKSTHISEDFKDLIMTIIDTGKFNARLFDRLPNSEKPLFKKLIDVAKLKHKLGAGNLVDENEKQQLQRWELVRGELESGNDNISLKKEAKKLITYFMKSGRLSKSEAYDLLIQMSL
jgi:regulator of replication initiation timing